MKRLGLLLLVILGCSCNEGYKEPKAPTKLAVKTYIIGDWKVGSAHADLDTSIKSKFPYIDIDGKISFYTNGRFKKHDDYYTERNITHKVPGFVSDYKVKDDSIFIYDLASKHWAAINVVMQTKDQIEINNRRGDGWLDYHYEFSRIPSK